MKHLISFHPGIAAACVLVVTVAVAAPLAADEPPLKVSPGTITVDHFNDTFDLSDDGCGLQHGYAHCGLREAVEVANTAGGHWDILLASGTYTLTRAIESNLDDNGGRDLKVKADVTITGRGPDQTVILANYDLGVRARVMTFYPTSTAIVSGTTIAGGHAPDAENGNGRGDAAWNGGGILNSGILTITHCLVRDNRAGDGAVVDFSKPRGSPGGDGGGICNGAAPGGAASLALIETTLLSNSAGQGGRGQDMQGSPATLGSGGPGGNGGGLANDGGVVLIQSSVIMSNTAGAGGASGGLGGGGSAGGAVGGNGGGVYSRGPATLSITQTLFVGNRAGRGGDTDPTVSGDAGDGGDGGGLYSASPLVMISSTLTGNYAGFGGDAFYKGAGGHGSDGAGFEANGDVAVWVDSTTIDDNYSGDGGRGAGGMKGGGGGDAGAIDFEAQTLHVENSTFSRNHTGAAAQGNTDDGDGGAISVQAGASCFIDHSTIAGNSAQHGTGGGLATHGTTVISNTIVAGNKAEGAGPDILGTVQSGDYNVIQDLEDATITGAVTHDISNTDPNLGPLADNGGPTRTHALLSGSPAIDAGTCADVSGVNSLRVDQRGVSRPEGKTCDIGAYEAAPATSMTAP
jgi:hypothetical protein